MTSRLTYSNVMSTLGVFIALGGTSYAVARNSVGERQLKASAVTSPKIKDGTVGEHDLADGVLAAGPRGPRGGEGPSGKTGATGPGGPTGATAIRFASAPARDLERAANVPVEVARLDNVPAGKWVLSWSLVASYAVNDATTAACELVVAGRSLATAYGVVGQASIATWTLPLSSSGATDQPGAFDVSLRCHQNHTISGGSPTVAVGHQHIVAIRADSLEVTGE